MNKLKFKCRCCHEYHDMTKNFPEGFAGWAYSNMEWSDFGEEVSELESGKWIYSETLPKCGEQRTVKVKSPFEETVGSEFYMEFKPAGVYFNGYDNAKQIEHCAIVHCRFERIFSSDEYCAWIVVTVLSIITYSELAKQYSAFFTDQKLEAYAGVCECTETELYEKPWNAIYWIGRSDIG